jgi:hypothetical protein
MSKKIIFVGSASRSGSTLLDMILGNDPKGFSLGEVYAHHLPWRDNHFNSICTCGNKECVVRKVLNTQNPRTLYSYIFDSMKKSFIVDSSKVIFWILRGNKLAKKKGYEAINILIYKDPLSLAFSHYKRGEPIKISHYYDYYSQFFETEMPFISVNYNEFVNKSPDSLKTICEYCEIPFFNEKINFWEADQHHYFGSSSVRRTKQQKNPKLHKTDVYPEEFVKMIPELEATFNANVNLQVVLSKLEEHDVLRGYNQKQVVNKYKSYKRMYKSILWFKYKRFFPNKWEMKKSKL